MGTRGAYGFRIDGKDKVTYNHFDSYPDHLGRSLMDYIASTPLEMMKEVAAAIILVDPDSKPEPELITKYKIYSDLNVSTRQYDEWYCLLRKTQGDLFPYNNSLRHMADYQAFLSDSLFCEWAYIINLDNQLFETYRGLNRNSSASGRYASHQTDDNDDFKGVALILETPLIDVKAETIDDLVATLNEMGKIRQLAG